MLIRFQTDSVCDTQTNGRTDRMAMTFAALVYSTSLASAQRVAYKPSPSLISVHATVSNYHILAFL